MPGAYRDVDQYVVAPKPPSHRHLPDYSLVFAKRASKRRDNRTGLLIEQAIIEKTTILLQHS